MKWFPILLMLFTSAASAGPLRHGSGTSGCPYINGTTAGDTLCPPSSPFSNSLTDSSSVVWQFQNTQGTSPNYDLSSPSGGGFGIRATLQSVSGFAGSAYTYNSNRVYIDKVVGTGDTLWFCQCSFQNQIQVVSPISISAGNFLNVTQNLKFNSFGEMLTNVGPGTLPPHTNDVLEVKAMPAGIPFWDNFPLASNLGIVNYSVTINFDAGVKFEDSETNGGVGIIALNASNITLNGGEFTNSGNTAWRVLNNATNPTLKNGTLHDEGSTCLLTGANNGTVTITGMLVYNCPTNVNFGGQSHNIYVSAPGNGVLDATCESISGTTTLNVLNDGWSLKIRPNCNPSGSGLVTNSVIGCTKVNPGCSQNGAVDYSCGGPHTLSHSVVNVGNGASANVGGWYTIAYGDEPTADNPPLPGANCPQLTGATNTLTLDHDIFIDDSGTNGSGFHCLMRAHASETSGSTCLASKLTGFSCTVTNSQIISGAYTTSLPPCTDGGGNSFYASRSAANLAGATGWGTGATYTDPTNGNVYTCCAFPYLPPHL